MECSCYLRNIQDPLTDGKTAYARWLGKPFHGPAIPFGAMVEYHPISAKDLSRLHQFGPEVFGPILKCYQEYPRLCISRGGNPERRHYGRG